MREGKRQKAEGKSRSRWALIAFVAALGLCSTAAQAQVIVTPFVSGNVRTDPGFIDLDDAASTLHGGFGVAASLLRESWLGVEGDITFTPSAFSGGDLIDSSRLLIASGSVLAVAPARWRWFARPYVSLGVGVAQIRSTDVARIFVVDATRAVAIAGVGGWAWLSPRVGVRAGVRFVRSLRAVESGSLETWQPSLGISLRF